MYRRDFSGFFLFCSSIDHTLRCTRLINHQHLDFTQLYHTLSSQNGHSNPRDLPYQPNRQNIHTSVTLRNHPQCRAPDLAHSQPKHRHHFAHHLGILLNLINVVNASTWPRDNIPQWFNGKILCDIELRIMIGGVFGGLCAAVLCLAKSLSRVLDMKRQKSVIGKKQHVHDALLCVGVPAWFMIIFYFCA